MPDSQSEWRSVTRADGAHERPDVPPPLQGDDRTLAAAVHEGGALDPRPPDAPRRRPGEDRRTRRGLRKRVAVQPRVPPVLRLAAVGPSARGAARAFAAGRIDQRQRLIPPETSISHRLISENSSRTSVLFSWTL